MQDFFGFVGDSPLQQIYQAHGADWQVWDKPRGITMIQVYAVGGGGGGGNGFTGVASSARGGGGGGGGGAIESALVPAWLIPDRLYVQVGTGGAAVAAGAATNVSTKQSNQIGCLIAAGNGGSAGGTGTASAAGAAGAGGAVALASIWYGGGANAAPSIGGAAGQLGGAQTGAAGVAASMATLASGIANGGAGGGGTTSADFAGGAVTSMDTGIIPTLAGGAAGSNRGNDGYAYRGPGAPYTLIPGSGGGASNAGVGGGGGNGGPACGGGGGGGGTTGGTGGRGGNGFVIITCW